MQHQKMMGNCVCAGSGHGATWHAPRCVVKRSGKLGGVNRAAGSEDSTGPQINKLSSGAVAGTGETAAEDQRGSMTRAVFVEWKFSTHFVPQQFIQNLTKSSETPTKCLPIQHYSSRTPLLVGSVLFHWVVR